MMKTFKTFEEANEYDAKEMALLTPEQCFKKAFELIKQIYKDELNEPMDKKIKFAKKNWK